MFRSFVEDLRSLDPLRRGPEQMSRLLADASNAGERFEPFVKAPESYTRTCLYADDRFEVLVLDWAAGASSSIHDHGGQHCWFVVLEGNLVVQNYDRVERLHDDRPRGAGVAHVGKSRFRSLGRSIRTVRHSSRREQRRARRIVARLC